MSGMRKFHSKVHFPSSSLPIPTPCIQALTHPSSLSSFQSQRIKKVNLPFTKSDQNLDGATKRVCTSANLVPASCMAPSLRVYVCV